MNRRDFLKSSGGVALFGTAPGLSGAFETQPTGPTISSVLAPWRPGMLDLHHINTGRGNATLAVMPDGTSLLIDAGASGTQGPAMCPARPDESGRPGEWIGRYVQRQLQGAGRTQQDNARLDYALITHLHGDHIGDVTAQSSASQDGKYRLTGISDVAEVVPVDTLIDRGWPAYDTPVRVSAPPALNYIAFVQAAAGRGMRVERVKVGSSDQIRLRTPERYPGFGVRMLSGNGAVWTGEGAESRSRFPQNAIQARDEITAENGLSIGLRIHYGAFSYFTGGDLNCDTNYGRETWRDVETPVAQASGQVSVSTCNHHGYFDACGPEFVRALRPRVWVLQSWHASHPALSTLANLYSQELYPGPRDVFCLGLHPAAGLACGRFSDQFKSRQGHVLVRVAPGGHKFQVLVIDDRDESGRVQAVFGPYAS
jgi:beta-lactamase superfamily II metal-dependent hydrolase